MKYNNYAINLWCGAWGEGGGEIRDVTQVIVQNEMVRGIEGVNDSEIHSPNLWATVMGFNGNK